MQTKLRGFGFALVASLLWIIPVSAGTQGTTANAKGTIKAVKKLKVQYIGTASWYGEQRQGRKMANGQRFDRHKLTAASWYFPLGTTIRVVNVKNGESVVVTITDRGPNIRLHRIVDLSEAAADRLGYLGEGLTPVFLYPVPAFETAAAAFDTNLIDTLPVQRSSQLEAIAAVTPM